MQITFNCAAFSWAGLDFGRLCTLLMEIYGCVHTLYFICNDDLKVFSFLRNPGLVMSQPVTQLLLHWSSFILFANLHLLCPVSMLFSSRFIGAHK